MSRGSNKIDTLTSLLVSTPLCSSFFGISERELRRWRAQGCPTEGHGLWNLHRVFMWWEENLNSEKPEDSDTDISEIKKSYWLAKTRVEEVKASALEEQYIPKTELSELWAWRAGVYKAGLLAFSSRLPHLLEGKARAEMREILHSEACLLLAGISRDHAYCPKSALPPQYSKILTGKTRSCQKTVPKRKKTSSRKK